MQSSLPALLVLIPLCCFLSGLAKGGLGGALGSLVTPLLALALPAPVAVGLTLPILIAGDIFAIGAHWNGWDARILWLVLPGTVLGVVVGSIVLGSVTPTTLQHGLGIVALLYCLYKLWEMRRNRNGTRARRGAGWLTSTLFGGGSAFASTLANAGGPPFTIYMLLWNVTPSVFVGTMALYFGILNAIKVPGYWSTGLLTPERILMVVWALPFVPFGVWTGILLDKRLDMKTFERLILVLLAVTGVVLLTR
jgi:uncharacterized protein